MKKAFKWGALVAAAAVATSAHASVYDFSPSSSEFADQKFADIFKPILNPLSHQPMKGPVPLGLVLGLDVKLGFTVFSMPDSAKSAAKEVIKDGSDLPSQLAVPRLVVQKGLPFGLDASLNVVKVPSTNITLLSFGGQYCIVDLISPLPKVSARGGYATLTGWDALSSSSWNVEGLAGLTFPPGPLHLDPYVGLGYQSHAAKGNFTYKDASTGVSATLKPKADWTETYALVGVGASLLGLQLGAEAHVGSYQTFYNINVGFGL